MNFRMFYLKIYNFTIQLSLTPCIPVKKISGCQAMLNSNYAENKESQNDNNANALNVTFVSLIATFKIISLVQGGPNWTPLNKAW